MINQLVIIIVNYNINFRAKANDYIPTQCYGIKFGKF